LAGAGAALEQRRDAARGSDRRVESPVLEDLAAMAHAGGQLEQRVDDVLGEHDIGPRGEAGDARCRFAEAVLEVLAYCIVELTDPRSCVLGWIGAARDLEADAIDHAGTDAVTCGEL